MKRLIACLIALISVVLCSIPVYAENNECIYLLSEPVPNEYVNELNRIASDIVVNHIRSDSKYWDYANSKIELGNPFSISTEINSYYFPVLIDNTIEFTINIYKCDDQSDFCWTCSEYLSDGLENLSHITSRNEPAFIGFTPDVPQNYRISDIFTSGEEDEIFIRSHYIPDHVMQFAADQAANIVKEHIYTDSRYYKYQNIGLQIAQPFTIANASEFNTYYFPVINNETIVFILSYYETPDHEYQWMISEYLAEELNTLNGLTAYDSPATIYAFSSNNKDIVLAEIDGNYIILSCMSGKAPYSNTDLDVLEEESKSMKETVDILQPFSERNTNTSSNILDDIYKMLKDLLSGFKNYIT